jgi:hypothetical protein
MKDAVATSFTALRRFLSRSILLKLEPARCWHASVSLLRKYFRVPTSLREFCPYSGLR